MSGHSKWATIKHKKANTDAKRAKVFAKLIRQVEVAAREGGGDLDANPTLRTFYQKARDNSIPLDTIERAIKRATGDLDGVVYEQITYEGYGPNGVAVLMEVLTDNRNRAASDVRNALTKNGGSAAEPGAVSWQFDRKGVIIVPQVGRTEDDLMETALEAGAEDITDEGEVWQVAHRRHRPPRRPRCARRRRHRGRQLRGHHAPAEHGADHRARQGQGHPAHHRRPRGPRRRPERLRQLRHVVRPLRIGGELMGAR